MLRLIKYLFGKDNSAGKSRLPYKSQEKKNQFEDCEDRQVYLQRLRDNPERLNNIKFIYCLVGNVTKIKNGQPAEVMDEGIKHFSSGTKLYCFPLQWGDGYEKIKVIGLHKKSKRLITIIIASKNITNWRLKTVYDPFVIKTMLKKNGWTNSQSDKLDIAELAKSLNSR